MDEFFLLKMESHLVF